MEITLENVESVRDKTGVSYKEAKEALEKCNGDVLEAIISIEENVNTSINNKFTEKTSSMVSYVKNIVHKGNVNKIVVKSGEDVVLNLPINAGIVGGLLFPWALLTGAVAALGTKCSIQIVKDDGDVIDVSQKATGAVETVVSKGGVVLEDIKDKGSEWFSIAKEKGGDFINSVTQKAKSTVADIKNKKNEAENLGSDDLECSDVDAEDIAEEDVAEGVLEEEIDDAANFADFLFSTEKEEVEEIKEVKEEN